MTGAPFHRRATHGLIALALLGLSVAAAFLMRNRPGRADAVRLVHVGPAVAEGSAGSGVSAGPEHAPVTVRVFGDYQCGWCDRLDLEAGPELRALAREGLIRYVYVHAPLRVNRRGPAAAAAAHCAAALGEPWSMHRILYERRAEWAVGDPPEPRFLAYAEELGLDPAEFERCLRDASTAEQVARDRRAADLLSPDRVPTVYIDGDLLTPAPAPAQLLALVRQRIRRGEP